MGAPDTLVQTAQSLLAEAGRPLNARRLYAMGERRGVWPDGTDAGTLAQALEGAPGIQVVRKGVFSAGDAAPSAPRRTRPSRQAEPAPEPAAEDRDRRKRRRTRSIDLVGDTPAAPLTVEDATRAARRGQNDREGLRRKLWARIRREAAVAAGMEPGAEPASPAAAAPAAQRAETKPPSSPAAEPKPVKAPAPAAAAAAPDPKAKLKAALRRRKGATSEPAEVGAAVPVVAADLPRPPEPPAEAPSDAYVEHRQTATAPSGPERRHPQIEELTASDALADAAEQALEAAGEPRAVSSLAAALAAQGLTSEGLAGVLRADSAQRAALGLRPRFVRSPEGAVGLLAWGLTEHYRALEAQLQETVAGLREAARRDLLTRVGSVSPAGFARVVRLLLERQGLQALETVHRAERSLALTGQRGPGGARVVVVAHQAWSALGAATVAAVCANLGAFGAEEGLLITLGPVEDAARAATEGARVALWDGAAFAHALEAQGVGLAEQRPVVRYPDHAFFAGLG